MLAILRARILSLGMILGVGFLLLISLVFSGAIAAFEAYSESHFPGAARPLLHLWNLVLSVGAITVLFAMLYKWLPNVPIAWKDVWMGAFITAVLFSAGRFAIGLYLGRSAIASAYGAAGTLVVLLLWLYYSAQVFLLGAEFTCLYATHRARCRSRAYSGSGMRVWKMSRLQMRPGEGNVRRSRTASACCRAAVGASAASAPGADQRAQHVACRAGPYRRDWTSCISPGPYSSPSPSRC